MKRKLKLFGVHIVALFLYVLIILPLFFIAAAIVVVCLFVELYLNVHRVLKYQVFRMDKPLKVWYCEFKSNQKER